MGSSENNNTKNEIKPKLSIVMPVSNASRTIIRTIQSVRAMGFKDWELIVVNAGSTDGTGNLVTPLLSYDMRIRYLYQSDADQLHATRQGVQMAQGELVMLISSDENCTFYNIERAVKQLDIMPGLEAVVGRGAAAGEESGLLIMRTDVLLDTALLYSRMYDFSAASIYRKLVRVGVMFGFVTDRIELIADADCSLFAQTAARRVRQFGQRTEIPASAAIM